MRSFMWLGLYCAISSAVFTACGSQKSTNDLRSGSNGSVAEREIGRVEDSGLALTAGGYCDSKGMNTGFEFISSIKVGKIINSGDNHGYLASTQLIALKPGSHTITLTPGYPLQILYTETWSVWIDFNQDKVFSPDEKVVSTTGIGALNEKLVIPSNAKAGKTMMRVSMRYGEAPPACGSFLSGEVEDYPLEIQASQNPMNGGDSLMASLKGYIASSAQSSLSAEALAVVGKILGKAQKDFSAYSALKAVLSGQLSRSTTISSASISIPFPSPGYYLTKGSFEASHLLDGDFYIVSKGDVSISHAWNSNGRAVVLALGNVDISHSANALVIAGGKINIDFDYGNGIFFSNKDDVTVTFKKQTTIVKRADLN